MAALVWTPPDGRTRRHTLDRETRIGRTDENDVKLDDPQVSKRHALISRRDGDWVFLDVGSRNGRTGPGEPEGDLPAQSPVDPRDEDVVVRHEATSLYPTPITPVSRRSRSAPVMVRDQGESFRPSGHS